MAEKKKAGRLIGVILVAGVVAGVYKYLKDYNNVEFARDEQIKNVKDSSREVKNAAKRTYIAIKDKDGEDAKAAAGELTKAAGSVISDAVDVAVTAGTSTVNAIKDIKDKYIEDPEETRTEIADNLSDMAQGVSLNVLNAAENIIGRIKSNIEADEDAYGEEAGESEGEEPAEGTVTDDPDAERAGVDETADSDDGADADDNGDAEETGPDAGTGSDDGGNLTGTGDDGDFKATITEDEAG